MSRISVQELTQTCEAFPSQWEGRTRDGRFVYVRYRHGWLQVGLGWTLDDAIGDDTIGMEIGFGGGGIMTYLELRAATQDAVDWPV